MQPAEFDWSEVNCFLRPQAVLCDLLCRGYGTFLLGLASLHRTWGVEAFLSSPDHGHFDFLHTTFRRLTGVEFALVTIPDPSTAVQRLRDELLSASGAAILPANLRELPYFTGFQRMDQRHYFLVTGYERQTDSFAMLDYLHVEENNLSREYARCTLPYVLLDDLAKSYAKQYTEGASGGTDGVAGYWVLQLPPGHGPPFLSRRELAASTVSECLRVLTLADDEPEAVRPLDTRFLQRLRDAHGGGDPAGVDALAQEYLAAANHSLVYLKVLQAALRTLGSPRQASAIGSLLEGHARESHLLRMQCLVGCQVGRGLSDQRWTDVHARLASLSDDTRKTVLAQVGTP